MPRYYFDLKDGERQVDPSGLDCLDDDDAMTKGEMIAREIERNNSKASNSDCHIAVINDDGYQIGKLPIRKPLPV